MQTFTLKATQSAASSFVTSILDLGDQRAPFIAIIFSSGAADIVGTLTLESSATTTTSHFGTVSGSSISVTGSANSYYDVSTISARYIRVRWAYTSGSGNITITTNVKDFYMSSVSHLAVFPAV